jgi:hypothetical protein
MARRDRRVLAHHPVQPVSAPETALSGPGRLDRTLTAVAAGLLAGLGGLPLVNWIPGSLRAPWYRGVALDLLYTTLISVGLGIVLAILAKAYPGLWREGRLDGLRRSWDSRTARWVLGIAGVAGLLYALVAWQVLSARPLLIDEIVQVFQARVLASGRLWVPVAPHPEFFSSLHLVEQDGRLYSQFPMGGPALLALGSLIRAEWLVGPVFGALAVAGFGLLMRRVEERPMIAGGATLLFGLAPFALFMSGSHMNHVTALAGLVAGMLFLARATGGGGSRDAALCGLGFGLAATIRPLDALAFALPAAVWLLLDAAERRRLGPLVAAGIGILVPLILLGWANRETTGSPFRFGYTVLWGAGHGLGFHAAPWGGAHTPLRGLGLINLYFLRLQTYLFEAGLPSLLPATVALALTRRLSRFDRYLLAASAVLVGLYFAYWHDGFYPGPRFFYPLLPVLALWSARWFAAVGGRWGSGHVLTRATVWSGLIAAVFTLGLGLPRRLEQYRAGLTSLRWDPDRAAARAGVREALVLVRESWGAELVARMWGLGIPRPDADAFYRTIDPCRLDSALMSLEARGPRGREAASALAPLQADSGRLVTAVELTGDPSLRLMAGAHYSSYCVRRLRDNQSGFTLFAPLLLARGNVYARDLGGRDSLLVPDYPGRPIYLLKPERGTVGAEPVFRRLDPDSLRRAWRTERDP